MGRKYLRRWNILPFLMLCTVFQQQPRNRRGYILKFQFRTGDWKEVTRISPVSAGPLHTCSFMSSWARTNSFIEFKQHFTLQYLVYNHWYCMYINYLLFQELSVLQNEPSPQEQRYLSSAPGLLRSREDARRPQENWCSEQEHRTRLPDENGSARLTFK